MPSVYSLSELAGEWTRLHPDDPILPRTLRYYIAGGLLEGPGRVGPGKHYGERHLERLEAIRLMQCNGHTIEQIRSLIEGTDPQKIGDIVSEQREILVARDRAEKRMLGSQPDSGEDSNARDAVLPGRASHAARLLKGVIGSLKGRQATVPEQRGDAFWLRIEVASGVEVFVQNLLVVRRGNDIRKWLEDGHKLLEPTSGEATYVPGESRGDNEGSTNG